MCYHIHVHLCVCFITRAIIKIFPFGTSGYYVVSLENVIKEMGDMLQCVPHFYQTMFYGDLSIYRLRRIYICLYTHTHIYILLKYFHMQMF